ncbi:hypothetical protein P280DRAFT_39396 [Massarina eburnea CBS 473.64]|uniref:Uncharacterized protein n=1 Tax=Massarina eburnea CBS 473.64 TaxID=1395130 RepID=A0A6A6S002_9PLEO|nr:hypothetical protein P280DRAFT_39396 [Massarina eburnea CBS 473.64]
MRGKFPYWDISKIVPNIQSCFTKSPQSPMDHQKDSQQLHRDTTPQHHNPSQHPIEHAQSSSPMSQWKFKDWRLVVNVNQEADTEHQNREWQKMRNNPSQSHVHNVLCPFWQKGDSSKPRPECPDKTFSLFNVNPFTKEGQAHKELLEERDRIHEERRRQENNKVVQYKKDDEQ